MFPPVRLSPTSVSALLIAVLTAAVASAAPTVSRLTPPSGLFSFGDAAPPIISRFLPSQRFDLQATVRPDAGKTITKVEFQVNGTTLSGAVTLTPATVGGLPANTTVATIRAFSKTTPGIHILSVRATQSDGATVTASGNFEIVGLTAGGGRARNIIVMIGDGMGIAHRTAARIMANGVSQGKALAPLAMDQFPVTALIQTSSLNSIVTDSAPGAAVYSTGNKNNNHQEGVFPDDTTDEFDNPRIENMGEYLARTQGKALGIVTTADVSDATPGAWGAHTQNRTAGTGICDQYLDEAATTAKLSVLLGGGRKWFLPASAVGSGRTAATDYGLPADVMAGWKVAGGGIDPGRNLIADFQAAGFTYVSTAAQLNALPSSTTKLFGLFAYSHMNVALDKIAGRRGTSTIVNESGCPDQPMLDEMTNQALAVLSKNSAGFVLMIEGASIDKQSHAMDGDRMMLEVLEFDRAVARVQDFVASNPDTLAIVTADHESGGINIIGASTVSAAQLKSGAVPNSTAAAARDAVVGVYESAGFPYYKILADGFPETTDVSNKILLGFAANADRWESWVTHPRPEASNTGYFIAGQVPGTAAVHTASDIPLSATGVGSSLFGGVMDNTDVFFAAMQAAVGGVPSSSTTASVATPTLSSAITAPSGTGANLVNLSNRCFVGTGERVALGGFAITGAGSRDVLIRGVGPMLGKFGVGGCLATPKIELLNSAGGVIASNTAWNANANAASIRIAATRTGAFALDEGSADAALLVTLEPGKYSVRLSGLGETTGVALLEVYTVP